MATPEDRFAESIARQADATMQNAALLARIDERTKGLVDDIKTLKENVVTRGEFKPVQMIAFGLIAVTMTAVLAIMFSTLIK